MGHLVGKDIYRKLGKKLDSMYVRTPWNDKLFRIIKELYSEPEARLIVDMPLGIVDLNAIKATSSFNIKQIQKLLDDLIGKGLVIDFGEESKKLYTISPMVVGIFEYTMMRTRGELNPKLWSQLFNDYMMGDDSFFKANFKSGQQVSVMRTIPHEESLAPSEFVEILDYEKAEGLIKDHKRFAVGICSCRHEKHHLNEKICAVPMESCTSFGQAAKYMIEHGFAQSISRSEMLDNLSRSKDLGLVLNTDNVKNEASFMCHCCGCCCNLLVGIRKFGYANVVVTSNYIASVNDLSCDGCGKCAKACPINAITMKKDISPDSRRKKLPEIDTEFCLGCGVCALSCQPKSLVLIHRPQKVLHPENLTERIILQALERGTLQNFIFTHPHKITHQFLRTLIGSFLKLSPVKKSLMSQHLRSRFLSVLMKNRSA
ncbi:MAG: 4Fe-4S dicluster domain-containing protein [Deltaproteobacteria bacterium]|jgi:Pyruvate/2-oxoacid:ferredoxin oxidoreductase delta subunit|nr:4Fe-4S dicluster domain-containing protein [Deltaproteobacteria bacterium]